MSKVCAAHAVSLDGYITGRDPDVATAVADYVAWRADYPR